MSNNINWTLDQAHSEITFKVRHLMISNVKGHFGSFNANVATEGEDFSTAQVELTIDPNSLNTRNMDRDNHLKSADFFETEKYPQMIFKSTSIEKVDEHTFKMNGDFTIKELTKPITLNVEFGGVVTDPWGAQKAGFTVEGKINRKDWGLTWNAALEGGGVLVGEDIKINCEMELYKPKAD
ncbi:MAG TPA: YceI family protein [Edaphocola sp.]|nr:YceI family protein [Edaphocola sp.]